jgi:hypothetical protein
VYIPAAQAIPGRQECQHHNQPNLNGTVPMASTCWTE